MNALTQWVGRKFGLTEKGVWAAYFGGSSWSGRNVTHESAMRLSAWFACTRLIAETISTLPLAVYEKTADGMRRPAPEHPVNVLLQRPNADQTPVEFWEGQVAPICIVGNSYAEKQYIGQRLVALEPIPYINCQPYRTIDGLLRYRFIDRFGRRRVDLAEERVFHIKGFGVGGDLGLSPVGYARNSLGAAMDIEEASSRLYGTGMRASGIFTAPVDMDKAQREQFRKNFIDKMEGPEAEGTSIVLPPNFKWQALSIPPKDAEMILSRKFSVEDIARWMGVPPVLIGHSADGQTMWGSGIEQIMLGWLTLGLRAYIKRIESAINRRLFSTADQGRYYAEFNVDGLVRADSQGRAALMSVLAQNGLRTRNELRAYDNMPPANGGDVLTVQSNLLPIDQLGKTPPARVQPAPGEPIPE
ncbi:MAG: phage portal protein [Parvibaculaceae bacterium]